MSGFVVWFTGLSGAGKSTLASLLAAELRARGRHVEVLDGDEVRANLSKGLGFSREDRDTNVRRIGFVARLLARSGAVAITAAISPYRALREEQRRLAGERFLEVWARCAVPELARRDPKGLWEKALRGEIQGFTGVDDPYEEPLSPEVTVDTGALSPREAVDAILARLDALGWLVGGAREGAPHADLEEVSFEGPVDATLALDAHDAALAALVAEGLLPPLRGPLDARDLVRARKERRVESGALCPIPWSLPAPPGVDVGSLVALDGGGGLRLRVTALFEADGRRVAGVVGRPAGPARSPRPVTEPGSSAGLLLRAEPPVAFAEAHLAELGLDAAGALLLLAPPGARARADALADALSPARVRVVAIPAWPALDAADDALAQLAVLRAVGVRRALLDVAPGGLAAVDAALARFDALERGVEVLATGPVIELAPGRRATERAGRAGR